jgi:hypothetical protein
MALSKHIKKGISTSIYNKEIYTLHLKPITYNL